MTTLNDDDNNRFCAAINELVSKLPTDVAFYICNQKLETCQAAQRSLTRREHTLHNHLQHLSSQLAERQRADVPGGRPCALCLKDRPPHELKSLECPRCQPGKEERLCYGCREAVHYTGNHKCPYCKTGLPPRFFIGRIG